MLFDITNYINNNIQGGAEEAHVFQTANAQR